MRQRIRSPLAAVVAVLCVVLGDGVAGAATYNLFQFNVGGHVWEHGNDHATSPDDPVEALYRSLAVDSPRERAASLNELCKNQFDHLMAKLPAEWRGRFVVTKEPQAGGDLCKAESRDGKQHKFGNAILVRAAPIVSGSVRREPLPYKKNGEHRHLICVTADLPTKIRFCSVHIAPLGTWDNDKHAKQKAQIRRVREVVNSFNRPVVLMGDFNTDPTSDKLDQIYHDTKYGGGAFGKFLEADHDTASYGNTPNPRCRCGHYTWSRKSGLQRKLDYIFFTDRHFSQVSGDRATPTTNSDHYILRGQVQI